MAPAPSSAERDTLQGILRRNGFYEPLDDGAVPLVAHIFSDYADLKQSLSGLNAEVSELRARSSYQEDVLRPLQDENRRMLSENNDLHQRLAELEASRAAGASGMAALQPPAPNPFPHRGQRPYATELHALETELTNMREYAAELTAKDTEQQGRIEHLRMELEAYRRSRGAGGAVSAAEAGDAPGAPGSGAVVVGREPPLPDEDLDARIAQQEGLIQALRLENESLRSSLGAPSAVPRGALASLSQAEPDDAPPAPFPAAAAARSASAAGESLGRGAGGGIGPRRSAPRDAARDVPRGASSVAQHETSPDQDLDSDSALEQEVLRVVPQPPANPARKAPRGPTFAQKLRSAVQTSRERPNPGAEYCEETHTAKVVRDFPAGGQDAIGRLRVMLATAEGGDAVPAAGAGEDFTAPAQGVPRRGASLERAGEENVEDRDFSTTVQHLAPAADVPGPGDAQDLGDADFDDYDELAIPSPVAPVAPMEAASCLRADSVCESRGDSRGDTRGDTRGERARVAGLSGVLRVGAEGAGSSKSIEHSPQDAKEPPPRPRGAQIRDMDEMPDFGEIEEYTHGTTPQPRPRGSSAQNSFVAQQGGPRLGEGSDGVEPASFQRNPNPADLDDIFDAEAGGEGLRGSRALRSRSQSPNTVHPCSMSYLRENNTRDASVCTDLMPVAHSAPPAPEPERGVSAPGSTTSSEPLAAGPGEPPGDRLPEVLRDTVPLQALTDAQGEISRLRAEVALLQGKAAAAEAAAAEALARIPFSLEAAVSDQAGVGGPGAHAASGGPSTREAAAGERLEEEMRAKDALIDELQRELDAARSEASSKGRRAEEAVRASQKVMGDVSSLGAAKAALTSLVAKLESKLDKQIAENVQLNEKLRASDEYVRKLADDLRVAAGEKRDLQRKAARLEASLEEARAHSRLDTQTMDRLDKANKAMGTMLARLTIENKRLKASLANIFDASGGSPAPAPKPPRAAGSPRQASGVEGVRRSAGSTSSAGSKGSRSTRDACDAPGAHSLSDAQSDDMARLAADVSATAKSSRSSVSSQRSVGGRGRGSESGRRAGEARECGEGREGASSTSATPRQDQQSAEVQMLIQQQLATDAPRAGASEEAS